MPIIQVLKTCVILIIFFISFYGLYLMFVAEQATGQNHEAYFQWALGAGLVFMAIGAALTAFDKEDSVMVQFEDDAQKRK